MIYLGNSPVGIVGSNDVKLLKTVTFTSTNEMLTITPTAEWDNYDFLLFVPDLIVTAQSGETSGNWLCFRVTGDKGSSSQYEGLAGIGERAIAFTLLFMKGWYVDRYYWRYQFLTGRGGSLQLKTVSDLDSESFSDLTYAYGGYRQETYALLNGTVKVYGGRFPQ